MTHDCRPDNHDRPPKNDPAHEAVVEAWVLANLPRLDPDDVVTTLVCDEDTAIIIGVPLDVHDGERPVVVTVDDGCLVVVHSEAVVERMKSEQELGTNSDAGMAMLSAVQAFIVRSTMAIVEHRGGRDDGAVDGSDNTPEGDRS